MIGLATLGPKGKAKFDRMVRSQEDSPNTYHDLRGIVIRIAAIVNTDDRVGKEGVHLGWRVFAGPIKSVVLKSTECDVVWGLKYTGTDEG